MTDINPPSPASVNMKSAVVKAVIPMHTLSRVHMNRYHRYHTGHHPHTHLINLITDIPYSTHACLLRPLSSHSIHASCHP